MLKRNVAFQQPQGTFQSEGRAVCLA
jgi:hypothetical protein